GMSSGLRARRRSARRPGRSVRSSSRARAVPMATASAPDSAAETSEFAAASSTAGSASCAQPPPVAASATIAAIGSSTRAPTTTRSAPRTVPRPSRRTMRLRGRPATTGPAGASGLLEEAIEGLDRGGLGGPDLLELGVQQHDVRDLGSALGALYIFADRQVGLGDGDFLALLADQEVDEQL